MKLLLARLPREKEFKRFQQLCRGTDGRSPTYKQWGTIFGDAPCLGALVDRFAQHCHVIDIDADSWRDKERLEKRGKPPKKRR